MEERLKREGMLLGEPALTALKNSCVAVIGLGGVGSWCAEALARAGVGSLVLVDNDVYSVSNRNRQLGALESTTGKAKAVVMAERIRQISPDIGIREVPDLYHPGLVEGCSYVADCIDMVSAKLDLAEECEKKGIPLISVMGTGNRTDAARLQLTMLSKTAGDPLARIMRKEFRRRGIGDIPVVYSTEPPLSAESTETPPPGKHAVNGSLVWVTASAGMLAAQKIVLDLSGAGQNAGNRISDSE